uniref:Uncharacterized protein n=1 Tax=Micrurus corallinus TaxID=54390 RepID=A0A2D4ERG0_MICCO
MGNHFVSKRNFPACLFGESSGDMLRILRPRCGLFCKMIAMGKRLVYSQNSHGRCSQPQNTNSPKDEDEKVWQRGCASSFLCFFSGHLSRLPRQALSTPFLFSVNDDSGLLQTDTFLMLGFNSHHSSTSIAMADGPGIVLHTS